MLSRALQTLAVLCLVAWILLSGLTGTLMMVYTVLYTRLWPVTLAYLAYMAATWDLMNRQCSAVQCSAVQCRGGWWSMGVGRRLVRWAQGWSIWTHFTRYFPIQIVSHACTALHCTEPTR
jgi:hypothetical protein